MGPFCGAAPSRSFWDGTILTTHWLLWQSGCKSSQKSSVPNYLPCSGGREQVRYTERLARSMGSDDDMFRIWSGPEGSSHKEPLSGIRIHRAHGRFLVPGHVVQKSPVKARLSNLIYPLRNAACWRCLGIDGCVVQETAALPSVFQVKRPVSLGWGNRPLLSLGLWIGEGSMLWRLF